MKPYDFYRTNIRRFGTPKALGPLDPKAQLENLKKEISANNIHLRPFLRKIGYDPSQFQKGKSREWHGFTLDKWIDRRNPRDPLHRMKAYISPKAFKNESLLRTTVHHELSHLIQRAHPQIFRGQNAAGVREFDAAVRDVELMNSQPSKFSPLHRVWRLRDAERRFDGIRNDNHWNNLKNHNQTRYYANEMAHRFSIAVREARRTIDWNKANAAISQQRQWWGVLDIPTNPVAGAFRGPAGNMLTPPIQHA